MADHQKALQQQASDYQLEFQRKDSMYNVDSVKWTTSMREIKKEKRIERTIYQDRQLQPVCTTVRAKKGTGIT